MKIVVVIVVAGGIMWYFGFHGPNPIFTDYSGQGGSFMGRQICTNLVPQNPYNPRLAQYNGFEWASQNKNSRCPSESSFIKQGCEEYHRQEAIYAECTKDDPYKGLKGQ